MSPDPVVLGHSKKRSLFSSPEPRLRPSIGTTLRCVRSPDHRCDGPQPSAMPSRWVVRRSRCHD
eukprot:7232700-Prymnesium_polylepis.1